MKKSKKIAVLYHKDCSDGFTAAWAAWKKFRERAEYIGVEHHLPPPKGLLGKGIYLLDFCYDGQTMQRLLHANKRVVVIDHHKSIRDVVEKMPEYSFDINSSGAALAWRYFHPQKPIPWLVRLVEDIDLWWFKIPHSQEIMIYARLFPQEFKVWSRVANELEKPKSRALYQKFGKLLLKYQNEFVEKLVSGSDLVYWQGLQTKVVNSPIFRSEIGNALLGGETKLAVVWYRRKNTIFVSLRSSGSTDVSRIAQKYGGGGHRNAAGFEIPDRQSLPWFGRSAEK